MNIMSSRDMTGTWLGNIYFYLFTCSEARAFDYQFGESAVHNLVLNFFQKCIKIRKINNYLILMI